jgi:MYXO-CTERM domain-containing protein
VLVGDGVAWGALGLLGAAFIARRRQTRQARD